MADAVEPMPIPPGTREQRQLSKTICSALLSHLGVAMHRANELPAGDDLALLDATSQTFRTRHAACVKRLLGELSAVARHYAVLPHPAGRSCESLDVSDESGERAAERVESVFDGVALAVDEGLDHFNLALDRQRGIENAAPPLAGGMAPADAVRVGLVKAAKRQPACLNIEKPQIHFPDFPIDNSNAPFVPPHQAPKHVVGVAAGTSDQSPRRELRGYLQDLYKSNASVQDEEPHPFEEEISQAVVDMSGKSFCDTAITVYPPVDETPFTFITTPEQLFNAAERIKSASEIAVDLENHSIRSFQGFVCLMQISTRREDFVIDALALRGSIHRALASVFEDETTVKVLHGADKDVQWLERDFGIYVVNMFDTGQAARVLKLPSAALSYLLLRYCSLNTQKKKMYQTADWRVRPIPDDMLDYARADTHYLLYIYDRLRSELHRKELAAVVWKRSGDISRKRHRKLLYEPGMARHLAARHALGYDRHQTLLLEELCRFRDSTAREQDESLPYVAPLHVLFGIVAARDKGRTVSGLLKHGFPGGVVPPIIYERIEHVARLVTESLDADLEGATEDSICCADGKTEENPEPRRSEQVKKECTTLAPENEAFGTVELQAPASSMKTHLETDYEARRQGINPSKSVRVDPLPSIKLSVKSQSDFWGAESDSSDDESTTHQGDTSTTADKSVPPLCPSNDLEILTRQNSESTIALQQPSNDRASAAAGRQSEEEPIQPSAEDKIETDASAPRTEVASKEQNNGSDSEKLFAKDYQEDSASVGREGIDAQLSVVQSVNAGEFQTETDFRQEQEARAKEIAQKRSNVPDEAGDEEEEPGLSILEQYESLPNLKKRKREKQTRQNSRAIEVLDIEPFDYAKARREEEEKERSRAAEAAQSDSRADPMRQLRVEWKGNISKAKKRRRGNGKSMNFRSR